MSLNPIQNKTKQNLSNKVLFFMSLRTSAKPFQPQIAVRHVKCTTLHKCENVVRGNDKTPNNQSKKTLPLRTLSKKPFKSLELLSLSKMRSFHCISFLNVTLSLKKNESNHCITFLNVILSLTVLVSNRCMSFLNVTLSLRKTDEKV